MKLRIVESTGNMFIGFEFDYDLNGRGAILLPNGSVFHPDYTRTAGTSTIRLVSSNFIIDVKEVSHG